MNADKNEFEIGFRFENDQDMSVSGTGAGCHVFLNRFGSVSTFRHNRVRFRIHKKKTPFEEVHRFILKPSSFSSVLYIFLRINLCHCFLWLKNYCVVDTLYTSDVIVIPITTITRNPDPDPQNLCYLLNIYHSTSKQRRHIGIVRLYNNTLMNYDDWIQWIIAFRYIQ